MNGRHVGRFEGFLAVIHRMRDDTPATHVSVYRNVLSLNASRRQYSQCRSLNSWRGLAVELKKCSFLMGQGHL